jgi:hypothetical protein
MYGRWSAVNDIILLVNTVTAVFAVAFITLYLRTIVKAEEIGPTPMSWILFAVGSALVAASAVLEAVQMVVDVSLVFHVGKVYFMLGNIIIFAVLFRTWRTVGVTNG